MKIMHPTSTSSRQRLSAVSACFLAAYAALAGTEQWQGQPGASASLNWTDAANWSGINPPQTYYNQVQFTGVGANDISDFSVNSIFDSATGIAQVPIWELDYINNNGNYTTLINPGVTLRVSAGNGKLNVGSGNSVDAVETIKFTGDQGAISVDGGLIVQQSSSAPDNHNVTLDMSELGTFLFPGASGSRLLVASTGNHGHGTVYLAKTNVISLGNDITLGWQGGTSNSLPCALYLGQENSIVTGPGNNNIIVGQSGGSSISLAFNPALVNATPAPEATFGGSTSDGRGNLQVAANAGWPNAASSGVCDFSGGKVTMLEDSIQLGMAGNSDVSGAVGVLTFDNGSINANSLIAGIQTAGSGGVGVGTVNVNSNATLGAGAILTVKTLTLASVTGTLSPGTAGSLNINGGAVFAGVIANGGGAASINLSKGTLTVDKTAGTLAAPIGSLSAADSSIQLSVIPGTVNVCVSNLTTTGANQINIESVPIISSYPTQITLIKYTGTIGGAGYNFTLGTLPSLCAGYLINNTANGSIDLMLTSGPGTVFWSGAKNGDWDFSSANWLAGRAVAYADNDFVRFEDGAANPTINLTATLLPGGIVVSNAATKYTYTGSGSFSGIGGLVKQGPGTLVLDNSGVNDFTGGVAINGGKLQLGNNDTSGSLPAGTVNDNGALAFARSDVFTFGNVIAGSGSVVQQGTGGTLVLSGANTFAGDVVVTNGSTLRLANNQALGASTGNTIVATGSTLDINGVALGAKALVASGSGVDGSGAIVNNGGAVYGIGNSVTLTGDTVFGGATRWDLSGTTLSSGGKGYNVSIISPSANYFEWRNVTSDSKLGNISIASGLTFGVVGSTTLGDPAKTLDLPNGSSMIFYAADNNVVVNKHVIAHAGATIVNGWGNNTISGAISILDGSSEFKANGGPLTLSGPIDGNGMLYKTDGSNPLILSGNSPSFAGSVTVWSGKLIINGLIAGPMDNQAGTSIAGSGTVGGLLDIGGDLQPGDAGTAGTLTAGNLTLENNATLTMDLGTTNTTGGGVNDLIQVNGDLNINYNTLSINPLGTLAAGKWYTLITYKGNCNGFFSGAATLAASRYTFVLTNITTTTPKQVRVLVTGSGGGPANLVWDNASADNQWNTGYSLNWSNVVTHSASDAFYAQDSVLFNDSTASTTINIPGQEVVYPNVMTVNAASDYTVAGDGKISGAAKIVKNGPGALNLNTVNDFTGNVDLLAGTILPGNRSALGTTNGTVTITNGATLEMNGMGLGEGKPFVISGSGINGNGAMVNNGNAIYYNSGSPAVITLSGDATIGGSSRWDLGASSVGALKTGGKPYSVTVTGNTYRQWQNLKCDTNLANIDVMAGELGLAGSTTLGNRTNLVTVHPGARLTFWGGSGYGKNYLVQSNASIVLRYDGPVFDLAMTLEDGSEFDTFNQPKTLTAPVVLNGMVHFASGDNACTFSNTISGPGGFYWNMYNSRFVFAASNSYAGPTVIQSSGLTLALVGSGSLTHSTNITLANGAAIDASGRTDKTMTLANAQVLSGNGGITGSLTVGAGATVSPGQSGTGTFSVSDTLALQGTALMDLDAATPDLLKAGTINYGGTLSLAFTPGTLSAGSTFKLFNAANYSGAFAQIVPAVPGDGLSWDLSQLTTSGTIRVTSGVNPAPTNIVAGINGQTLDLTWPSDHMGWRLQVQTNSLSVGLSTNWVDVPGSAATNHIRTQVGSQGATFYRMVYP